MRSRTARNVFLALTVVYIVLQVLEWVGVVAINSDTTPVWAIVLLGVFVLAWLGSAIASVVVALRRKRMGASTS